MVQGFSGSWPRPFAVGVLALDDPADRGRRSAERLDLALDAYRYGYFLIDTVEVAARGPVDVLSGGAGSTTRLAGYAIAEALAARAGADAFVTRGPVDTALLVTAAARHRIVVVSGDRSRECAPAGQTVPAM